MKIKMLTAVAVLLSSVVSILPAQAAQYMQQASQAPGGYWMTYCSNCTYNKLYVPNKKLQRNTNIKPSTTIDGYDPCVNEEGQRTPECLG